MPLEHHALGVIIAAVLVLALAFVGLENWRRRRIDKRIKAAEIARQHELNERSKAEWPRKHTIVPAPVPVAPEPEAEQKKPEPADEEPETARSPSAVRMPRKPRAKPRGKAKASR